MGAGGVVTCKRNEEQGRGKQRYRHTGGEDKGEIGGMLRRRQMPLNNLATAKMKKGGEKTNQGDNQLGGRGDLGKSHESRLKGPKEGKELAKGGGIKNALTSFARKIRG